jgi:hypothetical protein
VLQNRKTLWRGTNHTRFFLYAQSQTQQSIEQEEMGRKGIQKELELLMTPFEFTEPDFYRARKSQPKLFTKQLFCAHQQPL